VKSIRRGFRSFRRHPLRNLVVVLLLFVCLAFSLSMLSVKLAADSQTKAVKQRVGNYGELRSSSNFMMTLFQQERGKSDTERAKEARSMSEEERLAERAKTLVPENLVDSFSADDHILTFDKVLTAGITLPKITNSALADMLNFSNEVKNSAAASGITGNTFVFEGNCNGASAADFLNGNKKLIQGSFYTYADYRAANPVVLIEKNLADQNDLVVGDVIEADVNDKSGQDAKINLEIVGIYETEQAERQSQQGILGNFNPAGNKFFAPLSVVQTLNNTPGYVELGSYYFDNVDSTSALQGTFDSQIQDGDKYEFATDHDQYELIADPLQKVGKTSMIGLAGALGACALIILLAMAIIIGGRTRELGVLKALGATDRQVIVQHAAEVLCICLVSIILAMAVTAIIGQSMGNWLMSGNQSSQSQSNQEDSSGISGMVSRLTQRNLYKQGGLFSSAPGEEQSNQLQVVYQGSLLLYAILILLGISLLGMAIPVIWISRLKPARVLSME
jgi:ABC-type antimicrobial peptide transport system permease subunit